MGRFRFILYRPLQLVPVLLGISLVTFVMVQSIPGDPVRVMLGPRASEDAIAAVRARYGLDEPLLVQYLIYMQNLLQGDLGRSLLYRAPVLDVIVQRLPISLFLLFYGVFYTVILTVALAVVAARNRGGWIDQTIRLLCTFGIGIPSFWLGIILIMFFSLRLGLFPVSGYGKSFFANFHHLFLPALTVGLVVAPVLARNLRATIVEQMDADFVNAGRSKGLPEGYIFRRHVFWNSLLPTVNLLGISVASLIGGTVVIETVFAVPGLGQLMVKSILARDYFVVQGVTLILALGVVLTTVVVDIASVAIDPRVRL